MKRIASKAAGGTPRLAAALALLLAACAPTRVTTDYAAPGGALPRPQTIIVEDFATPAGGAVLDQGVAARLGRMAKGSDAASAESAADAATTADALAGAVVRELEASGLPATRGRLAMLPPGTVLLVTGQLLSVDEGNRTRRNVIGFGAGHSEVTAQVQLYMAQGGGAPQLVRSFSADARSGRKPGGAATLGAGAAAGRLPESAAVGAGAGAASELLSADAAADAERMGKEIAKRITALLAAPQ